MIALGLAWFAFLQTGLAHARSQTRSNETLERLAWIQNHREIVHQNRIMLQRLLSRHARGEVIGLELLVGGPFEDRVESRWGHSLLRFVDSNGNGNNDIVLGFVASLNENRPGVTRGLVGGYPVYPVLKPLRDINEQYLLREERKISRYVLPTSAETRKRLINKLDEIWRFFEEQEAHHYKNALEQAHHLAAQEGEREFPGGFELIPIPAIDQSEDVYGWALRSREGNPPQESLFPVRYQDRKHRDLGGYTFLKNNCAGALLKVFESIDLPPAWMVDGGEIIPVRLPRYLRQRLLVPFPAFGSVDLDELKNRLGSEKTAAILIARFSVAERMILLDVLVGSLSKDVFNEVLASLPNVSYRPDYDEIYGFKNLPSVLYELCLSAECVRTQINVARAIWSSEQLAEVEQAIRSAQKRIKRIASTYSLREKPWADYWDYTNRLVQILNERRSQ